MEVGTTPHESVQMLSAKTVLGFAGIMVWTLFFFLQPYSSFYLMVWSSNLSESHRQRLGLSCACKLMEEGRVSSVNSQTRIIMAEVWAFVGSGIP